MAKDAWVSHSFCYKSTDFISACWPLTCTCFPFVSHYNTPRNCWSALIDHTAILYYDWMLTLDLEISSIWKRPIKASTIYFVLNRYLSVIGNIFITIFITKRQSLQVNMCQDPIEVISRLIFWSLRGTKAQRQSIQIFIWMSNPLQLQGLWPFSPIIYNSQPTVRLWWVIDGLGNVVSDKVTQVLLILRTWALYQLNTSILLFMISIALILLGVASVSCISFCHPSCLKSKSDSGRKWDNKTNMWLISRAVMSLIQAKGSLYSWCIILSNILTLNKNLQCFTWVIHPRTTEF